MSEQLQNYDERQKQNLQDQFNTRVIDCYKISN